jgi:hypothetical protein
MVDFGVLRTRQERALQGTQPKLTSRLYTGGGGGVGIERRCISLRTLFSFCSLLYFTAALRQGVIEVAQ